MQNYSTGSSVFACTQVDIDDGEDYEAFYVNSGYKFLAGICSLQLMLVKSPRGVGFCFHFSA